jgi:hypothetical protein
MSAAAGLGFFDFATWQGTPPVGPAAVLVAGGDGVN